MRSSPRGLTSGAWVIAACLLAVEFLAGVQSFVTGTITPLMAQELNARGAFGVIAGLSQAAVFLTMPLGVALMRRWSSARLLLMLTPGVVLGGVVSALAPGVEVYIAGRILAGLAGGALMGVSLAALVQALPERWRRLVLAGYAATWIVSGILGPLYAGWVTETFGWRWALVGYLPLLWAVRVVLARRLRDTPAGTVEEVSTVTAGDIPADAAGDIPAVAAEDMSADAIGETATVAEQRQRHGVGLGPAVVLATGVALTSAAAQGSALALAVAVIGAVLALAAAARILPAGVFRLRSGRRSAIVIMALLAAPYFGAQAIVAILAHDVLGRSPGDLAALLAVGAVAWSVVGLGAGRFPAHSPRALRLRLSLGALVMAVGLGVMALAVVPGPWHGWIAASSLPGAGDQAAWTLLILGWAVVGFGMGACYLDSLDLIIAAPAVGAEGDGITTPEAATAAIASEMIATALVSTAAATIIAMALTRSGADASGAAAGIFLTLALLALLIVPMARRAIGDTGPRIGRVG